jgi:TRAP-type C4-dicarboxylate transport system permease large subunit
VAAAVSKEKVETIAKALLPFLAVEFAVIFLITMFEDLVLFMPRLLGLA